MSIARKTEAGDWRPGTDQPGVEDIRVSASAHVRIHRPAASEQPWPAVLWIHGGGYILGTAKLEDRTLRRIAADLDALVVSVEYRLAPEHPYPAALEDCHAALEWLTLQPDVDASRVLVSGSSAGGGLAAALALRCADEGLLTLAGQVLLYPMLDDRTATTPMSTRLGWTHEDNAFGWRSYLGAEPGAADVSPYAAPARRRRFDGLAPTWIGVGSADLFYQENLAYAERLRAAGVPTQLHVVPGAFHGFDVATRNGLARRFTTARVDAMRRLLATGY